MLSWPREATPVARSPRAILPQPARRQYTSSLVERAEQKKNIYAQLPFVVHVCVLSVIVLTTIPIGLRLTQDVKALSKVTGL